MKNTINIALGVVAGFAAGFLTCASLKNKKAALPPPPDVSEQVSDGEEIKKDSKPFAEFKEAIEKIEAETENKQRLLDLRSHAGNMLAAKIAISRKEDFLNQFQSIRDNETDPAQIASLSDDIRDLKDEIKEHEREVEEERRHMREISETEDPKYELAIARFGANLAKAERERAEEERNGGSGSAKQRLEMLRLLSLDDVMEGKP